MNSKKHPAGNHELEDATRKQHKAQTRSAIYYPLSRFGMKHVQRSKTIDFVDDVDDSLEKMCMVKAPGCNIRHWVLAQKMCMLKVSRYIYDATYYDKCACSRCQGVSMMPSTI